MNIKTILSITLLLFFSTVFGQKGPVINITFSKLLATYDFVQKLSAYYPDNECKKVFQSSRFHTQHYTNLVNQLDTLNIYESYDFQGYPIGQKMPVMTTSLIQRSLINNTSIQGFINQTYGIIPNAELLAFSGILSAFEPIYDSLINFPNKQVFDKQLTELKHFVQEANLSNYFQKGLTFYGSQWENPIPINIAVIPSIEKGGFTAKAFLNNAISEVPINFKENDILFSVLMHEIYHTIYDGQSLELKLKIQSWFNNNPSQNSQYAYLLLNEALATALGNGYVYEQMTGKIDSSDWYNVKYINLMAKQIFPVVKKYLTQNKQIDKEFVKKYISSYDNNFSDWTNELEHLLANRYVVADNPTDLDYFRKNYRYTSYYLSETPITQSVLEQMKEKPITKVIIISSDNKNKLNLVKAAFPELKKWKYKVHNEFVHTASLEDKTKLIIINKSTTSIDELLKSKFKNSRIK